MLNSLSLDRKKELEELANKYIKIIYSKHNNKNKNSCIIYQNSLTPSQIISSVKHLYSKEFNKIPTKEELAMMSLYSVLPNDEDFMKVLRESKYSTLKTAKRFSIPELFVIRRYKYILEKRKEEIEKISVDDLIKYIKK